MIGMITETLKKMHNLRERAEKADATVNVQRLLSLLEILIKVLEKKEVEVELHFSEEHSILELDVNELVERTPSNDHGASFAQDVDRLLANAVDTLKF